MPQRVLQISRWDGGTDETLPTKKKKAIKFCVITLLDHLLETKQVNPATEEHP